MGEVALLTLFLAGLLGSTHCVLMCGGLATALGAGREARGLRTSSLYQVGRVASYAAAGAIAGGAGAGGARLLSPHAGDFLRVGTAGVVVFIGLRLALSGRVEMAWMRWPERLGARLWRALAPLTRSSLPASPLRPLLVGALWGWLPCGLVYSALAASMLSGGSAQGALSMVAFGLGTVPAMLGLGLAGMRLPRPDGSLARLLGAVIVACGLWTAAVPVSALAGHAPHLHHAAAAWGLPSIDCQPRTP